MLYRAPVDTSPVTEGVTLFKHQLLLLLWCTFCSKKGLKGSIFGLKDTLCLLHEVFFMK